MELPSDDKRLEAEAFVRGMESTVMDLVARREDPGRPHSHVASRKGKWTRHRNCWTRSSRFRPRTIWRLMLTNRQQAGLASSDEREQRRIDQLLSGTRILLNKYLDPDQLVALQREVEEAEKIAPAAATGGTPTDERLPADADDAAAE